MTNSKTVLVLGGGVGGLVAANRLRRNLPARHQVILVERESTHVFAPSLPWLTVGARTMRDISRPVDRLLSRNIELVRGTVESIDPVRKEVVAAGRVLRGDHVIVALGAEFCPEIVPGMVEGGQTFCTPTGAEALHDIFAQFQGGRLLILTAAPAYKCPAAPYETAMLLEANLRRRGRREETRIDLYAAEPGPMGVAGPELSRSVRAMIEAKGIAYHPGHQVTAVDPITRRVIFSNGVTADYDLLITVPPHRPPRVVVEAGLTGDAAGVRVDRHTLATRFEGVYAIGDVTNIPLQMGKPLPKAGVFAHAQAKVVADNVARAIAGREGQAIFDGHGGCFVEVGGGRAGYGSGDFYAEPLPQVRLRPPNRFWHLGKVALEQSWLRGWS